MSSIRYWSTVAVILFGLIASKSARAEDSYAQEGHFGLLGAITDDL